MKGEDLHDRYSCAAKNNRHSVSTDFQCGERQSLPRTDDQRSCLGTAMRSRYIGSTKRNNGLRSASAKIQPRKNSVRKEILPLHIPRPGGIGTRNCITYAFRKVEIRGRRNVPHYPYLIKARRRSVPYHNCNGLRFGLSLIPALAI